MFGSQNSVMIILCALTITIFWLIWRDVGKTKKLLDQDKKLEEMNEFCNSRLNNINNSVNQYREECVNLLQHALPPPQHPHIQQPPQQPGMELDDELEDDANMTSLDASYQEFKENIQDRSDNEEEQSKAKLDDDESEEEVDELKLSEQELEDLDNLPDPQDDNEQLSELDDVEEVNEDELDRPNKLDFGNGNEDEDEDEDEESEEDELDITMKLKNELANLDVEDDDNEVEVDGNEVNLDGEFEDANEEDNEEYNEEENDNEEEEEENDNEEEEDDENDEDDEVDDEVDDEEVEENDETNEEDDDEPIEVDREYLVGLSKSELSEISKEHGLKSRGNKSELIDRIMAHLEAEAEAAEA